jgi:succinate dehydrogenase / fumarate reductase, flavoprotein subunit
MEILRVPVLVIGAGAAGLRAAIELHERGVACLVLGKRRHGDAHTRWAAGGINASLGTRDPEDRWEWHFADTVREAHFVCDPVAVELLCRHAPERVRELHSWGCAFSETEEGALDQRYFGAQTFRRTCFAGDRTGEAILETLVAEAAARGIAWREDVLVTEIVVHDGVTRGAVGIDLASGEAVAFRSDAVLLAAGGATSAYRRSSSRTDENNGDAVALALAAGAELQDMEFVQFHPTGMVSPPEMRGRLVTEAVRGEGGRLYNTTGERFMERYSPEQLELDARDVVARAIYSEIEEGRGTEDGGVLLDISHQDEAYIRERLPKLVAQLAGQGVDLVREPVEVAPTAHYSMGGVRVDFATGATRIQGLFAAGEATAGVHGANRLGGNSLAETVVFGCITGGAVADYVAGAAAGAVDVRPEEELFHPHVARLRAMLDEAEGAQPTEVLEETGQLLWKHAGIIRSEAGLSAGLGLVGQLKARAARLAVRGDVTMLQRAWEAQSSLLTAEAILRSALRRAESRGAHYRSDSPEADPAWLANVTCSLDSRGDMQLQVHRVPELRPELQRVVAEAPEPGYHQLE